MFCEYWIDHGKTPIRHFLRRRYLIVVDLSVFATDQLGHILGERGMAHSKNANNVVIVGK